MGPSLCERCCLLFCNKAPVVSGQAGVWPLSVVQRRGWAWEAGCVPSNGASFSPSASEVSSLLTHCGSEKPVFAVLESWAILRAAQATLPVWWPRTLASH